MRLAAPWIAFAFAGYLPPEQTLLLWDRVLGFDSLDLLPVLAAAVFAFRAPSLMAAEDAEEVRELMAEPGRLQIVPLLLFFLFHDELLQSSDEWR